MSKPINVEGIEETPVRKQWHEGEWYYNAIDVIEILLNVNKRQAQNYYHVLKGRLKRDHHNLPFVQKLKTRACDGKVYIADFINKQGIQLLYDHVQHNIQRKDSRIAQAKRDEIINFHPLVINFFIQTGWQIQHHVKLPSGGIIDLVAYKGCEWRIVECKPELSKAKLYTAIGQVLCYCQEYDSQSVPVIATYNQFVREYVQVSCHKLGIELVGIG